MRVLRWRRPEHVRRGDRLLTRATGLAGLAGLVFAGLGGGALLGVVGCAAVLTAISHNRQQGDLPRGKARVAAHRGSLQAATLGILTALGAVHWASLMPAPPPEAARGASRPSGARDDADVQVRGAHEQPLGADVDEPR
jgi:hypothetical protein